MKKNLIFSLMLLLAGVAQAQEKGHYMKFDVGGGMHKINYTLENGVVKPGMGLTGNIAYTYFFTPNWGIGSGLGIQSYKSIATLNYMSSASAVDADGDSYTHRMYYSDWQETQKMLMLDIPISLNYQRLLNEKWGMLVTAGTKISLPVMSAYETTGGQIATRGYYPQWNVELADMPQHNFNTYSELPGSDLTSKLNVSLFTDIGVLYNIKSRMDLYLGAYVGYGLSDVSKASDKDIYQVDGVYNGVLASNQVTKANLLSIGLKVGINLHLPFKQKTSQGETSEIMKNENLPDKPAIVATDTVKEIAVVSQVVENKDKAYQEPIPEKPDQFELARKTASEIEPHYRLNAYTPINTPEDKIKQLANILKNNPEIKLNIIGHTCNMGTKEVNKIIGLKRAETMKMVFIEKGVPANQISTETKYYLEPLVPNTSIENRLKNRRVELIIVE